MTTDAGLLDDIERYYDEVPRAAARTEEVGGFTLFVRADDDGWPYYARPRLGWQGPFGPDDVRRVRDRQRALGAPEAFEWVAETTPALAAVVEESGLEVGRHPLMLLRELAVAPPPADLRLELVGPDHAELGAVLAAVGAGFRESDQPYPAPVPATVRHRLADGTLRLVGAFDDEGPVGGGSHSPRGGVTELTGIAVLPRARRRGIGAAVTSALVEDARACGVTTVFLSAGTPKVAAIYRRVGFEDVGTACIAEAP